MLRAALATFPSRPEHRRHQSLVHVAKNFLGTHPHPIASKESIVHRSHRISLFRERVRPEDLQRIFVLRRVLNPLSPVEAMELLITYVEKSRNNAEFFTNMNQL